MNTRISTSQFFATSSANYQRNYSNVVKTQQQASDGLRIRTAADDAVGAARLLQLQQQQNMLAQYGTNVTNLRNSLGSTESVLNGITATLQRVNELAVSSGNGSFTDSDRQANAAELASLQDQLYSLMNSRDENGKYLFSGSRADIQPYVRNADGTFSYQGDESSQSLQIGDMISIAAGETGYSAFEQAINTSRSQTTLTAPPVNDGRVSLSNGSVTSSSTYNEKFRNGEPYSVEFTSSTQFKITDGSGNDVTLEATQNGKFDPSSSSSSFTFRGLELRLNVNFKDGDSANPDAAIAGHTFQLTSKPDSISGTRSAGNTSAAQVTSATVANDATYKAAFPNGGAVLKFTSATDFELYAQPIGPNSKAVASGTLSGTTATAAGVSFQLSGAPAAGDQYGVQVDTHQNQNILDTISQLRTALLTPMDNDNAARQNFQASLDSAIGNVNSAIGQVASSLASVGARGQALDTQAATNETLGIENDKTQGSIRDADPADTLLRLNMQQVMLQASLQAFSKISSLSLFNQL